MLQSSQAPSQPPAGVPWGPRQAWLGIAGLVGVGVASGVLLGVILAVTGRLGDAGAEFELPTWVLLVATLMLQAGTLVLAYVLGPMRAPGPMQWRSSAVRESARWALLGFRHIRAGPLLGWALVSLAGSVALGALYISLAEQVSETLVPPPIPIDLMAEDVRVLAFIAVVAAAPLTEEVFFRGFLFAGFAKTWGFWPAAAASSIVFALSHVSPGVLVPAFASGMLFIWVYRRTGSIWPSMLAHAAQNALAFALAT